MARFTLNPTDAAFWIFSPARGITHLLIPPDAF
jgi:hypothetical protein